ncbi:MAG: methyltransferase domain-containing protein [Pseudomonadota bacterium]
MADQIPDDYRESHLAKGEDYDADLSRGNMDTYMTSCELQILKSLVPRLFPNKIPRYLDFACGTGRITQVVSAMADYSIGLDVSENMISQARGKCPKAEFVIGDITQDDIELEPVDAITAFRFFGNAQDELRTKVLAGLSRIIKPGGYLIVNNHRNPNSLHERLARLKGDTTDTDLSHTKLRELFADQGFEVERTIGIGLWVMMHRLRVDTMQRSFLRKLEPFSRLPFVATLCPDAIVIARAR